MDAPEQAEPAPTPPSQEELPLDALAHAVLDRSLKPRVGSVRRLAEGVLDLQADLRKTRKKLRKAKAAAPAKSGKKNRKLATIPGQKKDK